MTEIDDAPDADITALLNDAASGKKEAMDRIMPFVVDELRRQARRYMRRERSHHTLQPTALVNEAYLRLVREKGVNYQNRRHFFAIAARRMREILVNHANRNGAKKRRARGERVPFDALHAPEIDLDDVMDFDETLRAMEASANPRVRRMSEMVDLRLFSGLKTNEIGECLGISQRTVERELKTAVTLMLARLDNTTVLGEAATSEEVEP